ncbi:MAG TPA: hypothetical protein VLV86_05475 [Vicinamibacterales bacterium]|nr:hypothetical protein [Vicinamibacterales bacterium]
MTTRLLVFLGVAAITATAAAQAPKPGAKPYTPPKTAWGDPDLQGTWTSQAELGVPFERSTAFGTRQSLSDQEFAQREADVQSQLKSDNAEFDPSTADISRAGQVGSATSPPPTWLERGKASRRTSLVIDPPDGRVPAISPAGVRRLRAAGLGALDNGPFDGPENMGLYQRCITRGIPNAMFPAVYNANTRIVQGPGFVAITYEMIHETRVIPTTTQPHLTSHFHQYLGDSRGHWDGDTLVVDVTNFSPKDDYRGSGSGLHLIERYTRTADGLRYQVTVDDPDTWAGPWTAALDLRPQPAGMFEYACHEGNYAMSNMLTASRAAEARAAAAEPRN